MNGESKLGRPRYTGYQWDDAIEFIYLTRVWWDGAGEDAIIWCANGIDKARRTVYATGEQIEPISVASVLADETVEYEVFLRLRSQLSNLSILHLSDQPVPLRHTHYDDFLGIKTYQGSVNQIKVPGGQHADSRFQIARDILFCSSPELGAFYTHLE